MLAVRLDETWVAHSVLSTDEQWALSWVVRMVVWKENMTDALMVAKMGDTIFRTKDGTIECWTVAWMEHWEADLWAAWMADWTAEYSAVNLVAMMVSHMAVYLDVLLELLAVVLMVARMVPNLAALSAFCSVA